MKIFKRVIAVCLVLIMAGIYIVVPAVAATSDELKDQQNDIKNEINKYKNYKNQAQATINSIKNSQMSLNDVIRQLDTQMEEISNNIFDLIAKIDAKIADIEVNEAELAKAEADRQKQYESMKLRIKFMYERGDQEELEILLSSQSLGEILNKGEYMNQITEYDRKMLDKLIETEKHITAVGEQLAADKAALEVQKENAENTRAALQILADEKTAQLEAYNKQLSAAQGTYNQYAALQAQAEAQNRAMEEAIRKALAAEEEARRQQAGGSTVGTGTYNGHLLLWPTNASPRRITCAFAGYPGHKGMDIGPTRGRYDDLVYAAEDGIVIYSQMDAAWAGGQMIFIKHYDNLITVYEHLSSRKVKVGDVVKRGQVIAVMGATGMATGQHLHFGMQYNGQFINPINYLQ